MVFSLINSLMCHQGGSPLARPPRTKGKSLSSHPETLGKRSTGSSNMTERLSLSPFEFSQGPRSGAALQEHRQGAHMPVLSPTHRPDGSGPPGPSFRAKGFQQCSCPSRGRGSVPGPPSGDCSLVEPCLSPPHASTRILHGMPPHLAPRWRRRLGIQGLTAALQQKRSPEQVRLYTGARKKGD